VREDVVLQDRRLQSCRTSDKEINREKGGWAAGKLHMYVLRCRLASGKGPGVVAVGGQPRVGEGNGMTEQTGEAYCLDAGKGLLVPGVPGTVTRTYEQGTSWVCGRKRKN
jgi:hypothetical protein